MATAAVSAAAWPAQPVLTTAMLPSMLAELRTAARECAAVGLLYAAGWAARLACDVAQAIAAHGDRADAMDVAPADDSAATDADVLCLARVYFSMHEFQRCAHTLRCAGSCVAATNAEGMGDRASPRAPRPRVVLSAVTGSGWGRRDQARFLRCYAQFLAGEKKREDECLGSFMPINDPAVAVSAAHSEPDMNAYLAGIAAELLPACESLDWRASYLLGIVLKEQAQSDAALRQFVRAVHQNPLNWSAWAELSMACTDRCGGVAQARSAQRQHHYGSAQRLTRKAHRRDMLRSLSLPAHWMRAFFMPYALLELQCNSDALALLAPLSAVLPGSNLLRLQTALANYNLRELGQAEKLFQMAFAQDPFQLEHVDVYSNVLYVREAHAELGALAQAASAVDKYRPETCCVIGNFYSLQSEHERAVLYFARALRLNRNYVSAWTLMGHEYLELKNSAAAVQAYRHAVGARGSASAAPEPWPGPAAEREPLPPHACSPH